MKDTSSLYPEAHIYPPARSNMDLCRNSFEESLIPLLSILRALRYSFLINVVTKNAPPFVSLAKAAS